MEELPWEKGGRTPSLPTPQLGAHSSQPAVPSTKDGDCYYLLFVIISCYFPEPIPLSFICLFHLFCRKEEAPAQSAILEWGHLPAPRQAGKKLRRDFSLFPLLHATASLPKAPSGCLAFLQKNWNNITLTAIWRANFKNSIKISAVLWDRKENFPPPAFQTVPQPNSLCQTSLFSSPLTPRSLP